MKNITLSAKEEVIQGARKAAAQKHSTLNQMFREWLENLSKQQIKDKDTNAKLEDLWKQTGYVRVGRKLSRDEMNER